MNAFRFGRGDFFGIIIPGSFLFFHLLIILSPDSLDTILNAIESQWLLYPLLFIACYILGTILRLITPSYIDNISSYLNQSLIFIMKIIKRKKINSYYNNKYPYINHFYKKHLKSCPKKSFNFWNGFKINEYHSNTDNMDGTTFINYCKTYIASKNKALYDEILYYEGLVRFLSGTSIALFTTLLLSFFHNTLSCFLFYTYLTFLLIILLQFRKIRTKETQTIFHIFENLYQS